MTNTLWGTANLVVGVALLAYSPCPGVFSIQSLVFLVGFLAIGIQLSRHFASVRKKD